ncbi:MAG: hypothetical protein ACXV8Q_09300 [Methylobacter sp.]
MNPNIYNLANLIGLLVITAGVYELYGAALALIANGSILILLNLITLFACMRTGKGG